MAITVDPVFNSVNFSRLAIASTGVSDAPTSGLSVASTTVPKFPFPNCRSDSSKLSFAISKDVFSFCDWTRSGSCGNQRVTHQIRSVEERAGQNIQHTGSLEFILVQSDDARVPILSLRQWLRALAVVIGQKEVGEA